MYNFNKAKELIIGEYKDDYLFCHAVLSSLNVFPHELDLVILNFQFDNLKNQLSDLMYDEDTTFMMQYVTIAFGKKMKHEPFGFPDESYFGILTSHCITICTNIYNGVHIEEKDYFLEGYNMNDVVQKYHDIPTNEFLTIKAEVDKEWETLEYVKTFAANSLKKFLKTNEKYL